MEEYEIIEQYLFSKNRVVKIRGDKTMKEVNGKLYILVAECDGMELKDYRQCGKQQILQWHYCLQQLFQYLH